MLRFRVRVSLRKIKQKAKGCSLGPTAHKITIVDYLKKIQNKVICSFVE